MAHRAWGTYFHRAKGIQEELKMNGKVAVAERQKYEGRQFVTTFKKRVVGKMPLMGSTEGKLHVLQILDETGGTQYRERPMKYPGHSFMESFFRTETLKDGKIIKHSGFRMGARAFTSGRYLAQRFFNSRRKREPEIDKIDDKFGLTELSTDKYEQPFDEESGKVERMAGTGTDVGMARKDYRIRFGMPPFENVLEFDEKKRLMGPRRDGELVSAPRLLSDERAEKGAPEVSGATVEPKKISGPEKMKLLPSPRPAQRRDQNNEASPRKFDLAVKGRSAARRLAEKKAREAASRVAKSQNRER